MAEPEPGLQTRNKFPAATWSLLQQASTPLPQRRREFSNTVSPTGLQIEMRDLIDQWTDWQTEKTFPATILKFLTKKGAAVEIPV